MSNTRIIKQNPSPLFTKARILNTLQSSLSELLVRYKGQEIDKTQLPPFQVSDMDLYTNNRDIYEKTDIEISVKLDITAAIELYDHDIPKYPGSSFTLFLMWSWVKALQQVPEFNFRNIDGTWYEFKNLPLFTTLAPDPKKPELLSNLLLEDFAECSWEEACRRYQQARQKLQQSKEAAFYPYPLYAIATHISNLRLPITHASGPMPKKGMEIERPLFVFGERIIKNTGAKVGLAVKLPHASLNPALLSKLIATWKEFIRNYSNQHVSRLAKL